MDELLVEYPLVRRVLIDQYHAVIPLEGDVGAAPLPERRNLERYLVQSLAGVAAIVASRSKDWFVRRGRRTKCIGERLWRAGREAASGGKPGSRRDGRRAGRRT